MRGTSTCMRHTDWLWLRYGCNGGAEMGLMRWCCCIHAMTEHQLEQLQVPVEGKRLSMRQGCPVNQQRPDACSIVCKA